MDLWAAQGEVQTLNGLRSQLQTLSLSSAGCLQQLCAQTRHDCRSIKWFELIWNQPAGPVKTATFLSAVSLWAQPCPAPSGSRVLAGRASRNWAHFSKSCMNGEVQKSTGPYGHRAGDSFIPGGFWLHCCFHQSFFNKKMLNESRSGLPGLNSFHFEVYKTL